MSDKWKSLHPGESDTHGRLWPDLPDSERCATCGQPDNCGDCNHKPLRVAEVLQLGGVPARSERILLGELLLDLYNKTL